MKTQSIFKGVATALITPLTEKGVDYPAFAKLIEWQIQQGINALDRLYNCKNAMDFALGNAVEGAADSAFAVI